MKKNPKNLTFARPSPPYQYVKSLVVQANRWVYHGQSAMLRPPTLHSYGDGARSRRFCHLSFSKQRGFTLIELIMAMALFTFMMAIFSLGFIQIMKIYQSGVSSRRTQTAARLTMEDISREV